MSCKNCGHSKFMHENLEECWEDDCECMSWYDD